MSNLAKLKRKAAEFEQKKQYEKALELCQQVLGRSAEEVDTPAEPSAFDQGLIAVEMGFRDGARRLSSLAEAPR